MAWGSRSKWVTRNREPTLRVGTAPISRPNSAELATISQNEKNTPLEQNIDITTAAAIPKIAKSHKWDPNLTQDELDILHNAEAGDDDAIEKTKAVFAEQSPYEEIRAAVRVIDSGGVANTVRAWVLGMLFVTVGSGLNMFLSMRFVLTCLLMIRSIY